MLIAAIAIATSLGVEPAGGSGTRASDEHSGLTIIAPNLLVEALRGFLVHKSTDFNARLVTLESILAATTSPASADDSEKLKRFLFDEWKRDPRSVRFVLLVGDADVLPVRYMCLDRNTDAAFNYAFYPSDLYYADLARPDGSFENWNAAADGFHAGYFGEVRGEHNKADAINYDGIDYLPEIAVGRWPVSTPGEVKIVAAKTIAYQTAIAESRRGGAKPGAAMIAVGGWVENKGPMDVMAAKLGGQWTIEKRYEDGPDGMRPPSADEVVSLINSGTRVVFHTGHGEPSGWAGSIGTGDLSRMTNAENPAIVLSAGCSTAYFATLPPYESYRDVHGVDHKGTNSGEVFSAPPPSPGCYAVGPHNRTGLGEALLRAGPTGAVAYFGCNTGSQPCGMTLLEGFADGLGPEGGQRTLGESWMHAVRYYHAKQRLADLKPTDDWYPPSIFFQGMKFMLFGDPSLEVR